MQTTPNGADGAEIGEADRLGRGTVPAVSSAELDRRVQRAVWQDRGRADRRGPERTRAVLHEFFDRWVSPRRNATVADLQRGKDAGELRSETEAELLNDAIFEAIYYRMLLRSGPMTRRFGEELVEQVIGGHRSGTDHK